jgi:hypothetical protein
MKIINSREKRLLYLISQQIREGLRKIIWEEIKQDDGIFQDPVLPKMESNEDNKLK